MSRQDKAISERHTKSLRELVKRPENKLCADCKRNDPRWASWNIGVFLCIRCSGIHRSMGTHISKVKSVDLDIWTPEQMESIVKWGNMRANLYWEAHLKPGHIPPEHKMESFIRSKYESRRWALEGPPPKDPSILEGTREEYVETPSAPQPTALPPSPSKPVIKPVTTPPSNRPLISAGISKSQSSATPVALAAPSHPATAPTPESAQSSLQNDLFSLDFHNPSAAATPATTVQGTVSNVQKDVKSSILSLYSTPSTGSGVLGGGFGTVPTTATQATSMMGTTGTAMWGAQSGWNSPSQPVLNTWGQLAPPQAQSLQGNNTWAQSSRGFGAPVNPPNSTMFGQNVWGSPTNKNGGNDLFSSLTTPPAKTDDAFGDLWGGFK